MDETEEAGAVPSESGEILEQSLTPNEAAAIDETGDLGDEAGNNLTAVTATKVESFRGPLPQPGALREYESILPGAADRILTMAENQASHRQAMEKEAVELTRFELSSGFTRANRGLNLGALVAMVIVAGGAFMAYLGYPEAGGGVIGGTIVGLAATFVYGARAREHLRESVGEHKERD